jgi:hypothetical protein
MPSIDLNGQDEWSLEAVRRRYLEYSRCLGVSSQLALAAETLKRESSDWTMPILQQVLDGVTAGDVACVQIAVDLVCSDARLPFGKIFKDRASDMLRRSSLSSLQYELLRTHAIARLRSGFVPPEFKHFARLIRQIGLAEHRQALEELVPAGPRIAWYRNYLLAPQR